VSTHEVLQLPNARYSHVQAVVRALAELVDRGQLLFPDEPPRMVIDYDDAKHEYKIDGVKVPSVTTILDAIEPKPALQWWSFRVGLAAVLQALVEDKLSTGTLLSWDPSVVIKPAEHEGHADIVWRGKGKRAKLKSRLEVLIQDLKLDPYNKMRERGTVGDSIHAAAEQLGITETIPTIGNFPEADRGFVQALARYWVEQEPEVEQQEVIVASKRFGFAGRFDKIVRTPGGQRRFRDYKTSGGVYSSFDKQVSLYDLANRDMGDARPVDGFDVVHLRPDGTYAVIPLSCDPADALVALLKFHQDRDLHARVKALGREP
jgi:hypothetical protein